jgi:hypothetical protein
MCNPVAVTVVAALFSANQQAQQAKFAKGTARFNERLAENEAQETRNVGNERENIQRRRTAELLSKQKAQLGASGLDLGSGSPFDLQEDTQLLGEIDAQRIRSNTDSQVSALNLQAGLTRSKGNFAGQAGTAAFGTLLSGASKAVDSKWFTDLSAANTTRTT